MMSSERGCEEERLSAIKAGGRAWQPILTHTLTIASKILRRQVSQNAREDKRLQNKDKRRSQVRLLSECQRVLVYIATLLELVPETLR